MHACVCLCACMCVFMCVCVHACLCVHACMCVCVCVFVAPIIGMKKYVQGGDQSFLSLLGTISVGPDCIVKNVPPKSRLHFSSLC